MRKLLFSVFIVSSFAAFSQRLGITQLKVTEDALTWGIYASNDNSYMIGPDGNALVTWNRSATGYAAGKKFTGGQPDGEHFRYVGISPDGNYIAATSDAPKLYIFRRGPAGFKKILVITDFEGYAEELSFSSDGKYLAAATHGSQGMIIWKIDGDVFTKTDEMPECEIMMFSPADPDLLYAKDTMYRLKNGKLVRRDPEDPIMTEPHRDPEKVAFSPDGKYFVSKEDYEMTMHTKGKDGKFHKTCYIRFKDDTDCEAIHFSPDSRYLFFADNRERKGKTCLQAYKVENDSLIFESSFGEFEKKVDYFQFSPDGKYMVLGDDDWEGYLFKVDGIKASPQLIEKPAAGAPVTTTATPVKTQPTPAKTVTPNITPAITNITNIFWINPNPEQLGDKPVVSEKNTIEIQIKVISSKQVTKEDIRIIINGKEQGKNKFNEVALNESKQDELFEYTYANAVPLEETADHINTIDVFVNGKKSAKPLKVIYSVGKPNLHILAIGTSLDLQFPKKDAQDFADLFKNQGGSEADKLFGTVTIHTLIGKDATTNAIKESIERFRYDFKTGGIGSRDVMLVFISSHGFLYQDQLRIQGDDYKEIYKETYSVAYNEITSRLKEVNCKKLIFLDACFSGGAKANVADINNAIRDLNAQGEGVLTFSSSSNDEYSYEDEKWQNGAFTYSIKQGLADGKADADGNGIITVAELYTYVSAKVPQIVSEVKGKPQHPTMPVSELLKNTAVFVTGK